MIQSSTATNQQKTSVWLPTPGSRSKHGGKGTYPWVSLCFLPFEKVRRRSHKSLTFCAFTLVVLPTWYVLKIYSWKQAVSLPIFDTFKWRFFTTSSWEETCTWPTIYDGRFFLPRTGPKLRFFLVLRNCLTSHVEKGWTRFLCLGWFPHQKLPDADFLKEWLPQIAWMAREVSFSPWRGSPLVLT